MANISPSKVFIDTGTYCCNTSHGRRKYKEKAKLKSFASVEARGALELDPLDAPLIRPLITWLIGLDLLCIYRTLQPTPYS